MWCPGILVGHPDWGSSGGTMDAPQEIPLQDSMAKPKGICGQCSMMLLSDDNSDNRLPKSKRRFQGALMLTWMQNLSRNGNASTCLMLLRCGWTTFEEEEGMTNILHDELADAKILRWHRPPKKQLQTQLDVTHVCHCFPSTLSRHRRSFQHVVLQEDHFTLGYIALPRLLQQLFDDVSMLSAMMLGNFED